MVQSVLDQFVIQPIVLVFQVFKQIALLIPSLLGEDIAVGVKGEAVAVEVFLLFDGAGHSGKPLCCCEACDPPCVLIVRDIVACSSLEVFIVDHTNPDYGQAS
jgi:hypothetical protein